MPAFMFVSSLGGGNLVPAIHKFPVATGQTLKAGDPVKLSSGQVVKGGDGFGRCLGVMAQDAIGLTAGTKVEVYIVRPDQLWRCVASADATSHVLIARTYDLNASLQVNVADTTGGCLQIVQLGDSVTDIYAAFTATEF
ncbi:MAG TPA: hypothetical protein VHO69_11180 [Phototrophicaceae bacterium]|nr:hypothetical protein [Phototrophicaceae bacterium]